MLDIRTLMLSTGITSLLLGAIMFLTVRNYAGSSRAAMRIWACGQGVQPLGWFLLALRHQIPDVLSLILGNLLIVGGFNACAHALDVFMGRRARHEIFVALVLLNLALTTTFTYWPSPTTVRLIGLSCVLMLVFLLITQAVLAVPGPQGRRPASHWITAGIFAFGVVVLLARIIALLIGGVPDNGRVFVETRMEQIVFVYTSFVNIIGTFGFVMMCNDRFNGELTRLAAVDSLTGVFNRRTFAMRARQAFDLARREADMLGLLLIDGDHFKRINDEHGHAAGDEALRVYAQTFRGSLRNGDTLGRVGGEEFAVLLPGCDEHAAQELGERLRAAVETRVFEHEGRNVPLRVSVGVAAMSDADSSFEALLRRADRALYAAKRGGRNRVVAATTGISMGPGAE
ncbi:MAG: GGDEF domain-containing protein [Rudaea sp.]